MASELLVNKITPESGTTLTLGDTGDTISFASGVLPTLESLTITGDLTVDTNTLYVDSTNNRVGVGTASPTSPLTVSTSSGAVGLKVISTSAGTLGPDLSLQHDSASPADNDIISLISFQGNDSGGTNTTYSQVRCIANNVTDTTEDGSLTILTTSAGTLAERMRIDSSGNLLMGTTALTTGTLGSANQFAELAGGSTGSGTLILSRASDTDASEIGGIRFANANNADDGGLDADGKLIAGISGRLETSDNNASDDSGGHLVFYTKPEAGNYAERMRIDSSGNVLVGKTSTDQTVAGTTLFANGKLAPTVDSDTVIYANRETNDGSIIELRKDGVSVGSIGVASSDLNIYGDVGIKFSGDDVRPTDSSGNNSDNAVDLGHFDVRWQDLYLGGNIYLGGTGSANALDDYEEGTFTPSWGGSTTDPSGVYSALRSGSYTKVGRLVTVLILIRGGATTSAGSGNLLIRGLPFASATTTGAERGSFNINYSNDFLADNTPAGGYGTSGESYITLLKYSSDPRDGLFSNCTTTGSLNTGSSNFNYIIIGGHYYTD